MAMHLRDAAPSSENQAGSLDELLASEYHIRGQNPAEGLAIASSLAPP